MTSLEASEDEKSAAAIAYLLSLIIPKYAVDQPLAIYSVVVKLFPIHCRVPSEVLQSRYSQACKIIADKLSVYETSDSTSLLKGVSPCQCALVVAGPTR